MAFGCCDRPRVLVEFHCRWLPTTVQSTMKLNVLLPPLRLLLPPPGEAIYAIMVVKKPGLEMDTY